MPQANLCLLTRAVHTTGSAISSVTDPCRSRTCSRLACRPLERCVERRLSRLSSRVLKCCSSAAREQRAVLHRKRAAEGGDHSVTRCIFCRCASVLLCASHSFGHLQGCMHGKLNSLRSTIQSFKVYLERLPPSTMAVIGAPPKDVGSAHLVSQAMIDITGQPQTDRPSR